MQTRSSGPTISGDSNDVAADAVANTAAQVAGAGDDLVSRVVVGLHGAVDQLADQVTPIVDRVKSAGEAPGEWTDAARDAIRANPVAFVAGALVVGAGLLHLLSPSRR